MMQAKFSQWATVMVLAGTAMPVAARAQSSTDARPFTGVYAGPEIGALEHHYYLEETDLRTGATDGRYYRDWDVGGGAFAGYDFALAKRIRIGAEASVNLGGGSPVAQFADGTRFSQHPRFGLRGTARLGYVVSNRLLAYATFGYGGQRYRIGNSAGVRDTTDWGSSFTVGGGLEYRLARHVGVRLDFEHLDNSSNSVLLGIPLRF